MATADTSDPRNLAPDLEPAEREEIRCLDFYLAELLVLHQRDLIPEATHATIDQETRGRRKAIVRRGRAKAQFAAARERVRLDPRAAAELADLARDNDPSSPEVWQFAISLHHRLGENDRARTLCEEANARFPEFPIRPDSLDEATVAAPAPDLVFVEEPETEAEALAGDTVMLARAAMQGGDDHAVIALCNRRLAREPEHFDSLVLLAFAHQRQNHLDESLKIYRQLLTMEPHNEVWKQWVRKVAERRTARDKADAAAVPEVAKPRRAEAVSPAPVVPAARPAAAQPVAPVEPGLSWASVTGEFLQDHWQKLILCLAVLLIVVSSNVGAAQLLGPKIWSPVGKSMLALVYTAMFAAFGTGLVRWGAERAGRIMLLTTLIVVPADFMLAGQMKLLDPPSPFGIGLLVCFSLALFLLTRSVAWALGLTRGAWGLSAALFGLSVFNAAASTGTAWPWSWQFVVFLAPAALYLLAVSWLNTRFQQDDNANRLEVSYFALGLFTFALLTGVVRTGGFVLELPRTLYAVPVMIASIAAVQSSKSFGRFDPDKTRAAWLRMIGLSLAGLAMAMALARPQELSPLYSGNTLATAVLGLLLFVALLWTERHPAHLYVAFGTLIVAYFGAFYFVHDLVHAMEEVVRQAVGERGPLPQPYKAINGLVFNTLLAGLSIAFRRRWHDERLARHCHYLGVPFSIACCAFSVLVPKAAVICLSGYAVLYAVAVGVFTEPRLLYLAAAAGAGAAWFGTSLIAGATPAHQSLALALTGLLEWTIGAVFKQRGFDESYRRPSLYAAMTLAVLATVAATLSALPAGPAELPAAAALIVVAAIAVLANHDEPHPALGYLAAVAGSLGYAFVILHAVGGVAGLSPAQFAVAGGSAACVLALLGARLNQVMAHDGAGSAALAVYPRPLSHVAFVHIAVTVALCGLFVAWFAPGLTTSDHGTLAAALGLGASAVAVLLGIYPLVPLVYLALTLGLGAWVALARAIPPGDRVNTWAEFGATVACYALAVLAAGEALRSRSPRFAAVGPEETPTRLGLFARSFPEFVLAVAVSAVALTANGWTNGPAMIATFAAAAFVFLGVTRARPVGVLVDLGVALAVLAAWCLTAHRLAPAGFLLFPWLAVATAVSAVVVRGAGQVASLTPAGAFYGNPCHRQVSILAWIVLPLALFGWVGNTWLAYPHCAAALVVSAVVLLSLTAVRARPSLTYRAIFAAVLAVYVIVLSQPSTNPQLFVPGMVAVILGLVLQGLGFVGRSRPREEWERLYFTPLFHSAFVLTALGAAGSFWSPASMLLAGLSFLLLVKGIPSRNWIYLTVTTCCVALYYGYLVHQPAERMVTAAIVVAYELWIIGLLWRRVEPTAARLLGLPGAGYDHPVFHSAVVAAAVAGLLQLGTLDSPSGIPDSAGLLLNLAVFSLLMTKPYPSPGWVHGSVVLASSAAAMALYPHVETPLWWLPLGLALANGWQAAAWALRRFGGPLSRWLGVRGSDFTDTFDVWSRAFFTLFQALVMAVVLLSVIVALVDTELPVVGASVGGWWCVLLAIGLGAAYVVATWWVPARAECLMGLGALGVLSVWWLGGQSSPLLPRLGIAGSTFLPPATAALGLGAVATSVGLVRRPGNLRSWWRPDPDADVMVRLDAYAMQLGGLLAVIAAAMAMAAGTTRPVAVATLFTGAGALGLAAVGRRWVPAGYGAGLLLATACGEAGLTVTAQLGMDWGADRVVALALGLLAAVAILWSLAGLVRRRDPEAIVGVDPVEVPTRAVAPALEQVALAAALFCAGGVVSTVLTGNRPTDLAAATGVGILAALTLVAIGLLVRWGASWLVYAAQAAVLGSYFYYRWAFPIPAPVDAVVLTLLGYLDFGLAEMLPRVGLERFAAPTRRVSLGLLLIPLVLAFWGGPLWPFRMLLLFAAATFYGIACLRLQSKPIGYVAAVLYNAALWVLWSQVGWQFTDSPQLFIVPAGLTAILFAEVNRGTLQREALNMIRGVGLSMIYLSLAVPIWEHQSLFAWLTLLLLSLAGIFAGIGLRLQTFLWLGLASFVLDVVYQLGRVGTENTLARWGIMLALGIALVLFVALNEKKQILKTMRGYFKEARQWE